MLQNDNISSNYYKNPAPAFRQSRSQLAKYDRIVEIVRNQPNLAQSEIANILYPATAASHLRYNLNNLLLTLSYNNRIQMLPDGTYIALRDS